jgi:hypothetical protein
VNVRSGNGLYLLHNIRDVLENGVLSVPDEFLNYQDQRAAVSGKCCDQAAARCPAHIDYTFFICTRVCHKSLWDSSCVAGKFLQHSSIHLRVSNDVGRSWDGLHLSSTISFSDRLACAQGLVRARRAELDCGGCSMERSRLPLHVATPAVAQMMTKRNSNVFS